MTAPADTARTGVLLMAYGSPAAPEDIEAYYTDIRRGRPPTPEQLADLVRRYEAIGGLSPLAARTEAQRVGLQRALDAVAPERFDVVLGFKHTRPTIEDGVAELAAKGIAVVVALVLAPHFSGLSVGEYLERADAASADQGVTIHAIRSWHLERSYIDFLAGAVRTGLIPLPPNTKVVFTAHSLPQRILATADPYPDEVFATAQAVAHAAGLAPWAGWGVAWQSAGRTAEPWIGPDLLTVIDELAPSENADGVLVCACGFVSDHLEVLHDLDIAARARAEQLGLAFGRTPCVNDDPTVMQGLAELVVATARAAATTL